MYVQRMSDQQSVYTMYMYVCDEELQWQARCRGQLRAAEAMENGEQRAVEAVEKRVFLLSVAVHTLISVQ